MRKRRFQLHQDHVVDHALIDFAVERLEQARALHRDPVLRTPAIRLPSQLPESGVGARAALEHLAEGVLAGTAQLHHPGYLAHMDPPTACVTWVAALWQAAANQNLLHPDAAPTARELETRVIEWLAPYYGMHGGHMVPGSTVANFTALWAAREVRGIRCVAASERAHLSVRKAADILGLEYRVIETGASHRLRRDRLGALERTAVVLTAGTVATGAIDALDSLESLGAAWVHVDAAWGGPLRFTQRYATRLEGVSEADSVGFSAHKWCYQPKGSAFILFKDPAAAHGAMRYGGGYLSVPNIGLLGSAPANALPLAATLLAWGRTGLAQRIEDGMSMADTLVEILDADPRFELWGPHSSAVVVWRPRDAMAADVHTRLREAWVSLVNIDGETWFRSVAANPSADPGYVVECVAEIL